MLVSWPFGLDQARGWRQFLFLLLHVPSTSVRHHATMEQCEACFLLHLVNTMEGKIPSPPPLPRCKHLHKTTIARQCSYLPAFIIHAPIGVRFAHQELFVARPLTSSCRWSSPLVLMHIVGGLLRPSNCNDANFDTTINGEGTV